jgi:hypothetical protein
LKKDFSRLLQLGLIGYDQWQVSNNGRPTSVLPFYSVHAIGFQTNFILPGKGVNLFFKYEPEFRALISHRPVVFPAPAAPPSHY